MSISLFALTLPSLAVNSFWISEKSIPKFQGFFSSMLRTVNSKIKTIVSRHDSYTLYSEIIERKNITMALACSVSAFLA